MAFNLDGFIKLSLDDVEWYTDKDGEPYWKPKNPIPGESYCLMIPEMTKGIFSASVPILSRLFKRNPV